MKLLITQGNYHIFLLMIKKHIDLRINIKQIKQDNLDMIINVETKLPIDQVISILTSELKASTYRYLCPCFKIIPYKHIQRDGHKESSRFYQYQFE